MCLVNTTLPGITKPNMFNQQPNKFGDIYYDSHDTKDMNKYCISKQQHKPHKIQYVCLENACMLNRLICRQCLRESHRKHKIGVIDKLIQPLNRLSMNSYHPKAEDDYNYIYNRIQSIVTEWEKIHDIFMKNMEELQNGILFQLDVVLNTFSGAEAEKAEQILLNGDSEIDVVNQVVAKLNFLNKDYFSDTEKVKKYTDKIIERTKKAIIKNTKAISTLFSKMQEYIKRIDFNNCDSITEDQLNENSTHAKPHNTLLPEQEKTNILRNNREGDSESEEEKIAAKKDRKEEERQDSNTLTNRFATGLGPQKLSSQRSRRNN